ncbi:uncharacterized protein METZ01_LOCUS150788, partial [marine metagenome]
AGAAHHVPPDGGRCDHSRHRVVCADPGALHRQESVKASRGPQVRHFPDDHSPHVLVGAGDDRVLLPGSRLQLHLPLELRPLLRTV